MPTDPIANWITVATAGAQASPNPVFGDSNSTGMVGRSTNILTVDYTTSADGGTLQIWFYNGALDAWIPGATRDLVTPGLNFKWDTQGRVCKVVLSGSPHASLEVRAVLLPGNEFAGGN